MVHNVPKGGNEYSPGRGQKSLHEDLSISAYGCRVRRLGFGPPEDHTAALSA